MFASFQHRGWHYAILLLAGAALFLTNLGGASLWDLDEGRNSSCACEMLAGGNVLVPYFNGELRVDKPVLLYWLQMLGYSILGISEFTARLPSALAALATMLVCYELGRTLFGKTTGLLAGLIVGSTPMLCSAARFANPDALLNLFIVLAMFMFWRCQQGGGAWWFVGLGTACGFAALAKGPVGIVLPAAIAVVFCLWTRQPRMLLDRRFQLMWLAFILVALPWYILVGVETRGEFLRGFLIDHNVRRATSPMENHRGNFLYYPLVLLLGTAPWSIFAGSAFWYGFRRSRHTPCAVQNGTRSVPTTNTAACLLGSWIGVIMLFFTLASTKLPNYILPVTVPFALLTADFLVRWCRREIAAPSSALYASLAFLLLVGIGLSVGLMLASGAWPVSWLSGRSFPGLEQGAAIGLLPLSAALLGFWLLRRERRTALVWTMTLSTLGFIVPLIAWGSSALDRFKAPRALVELAQARRTSEDVEIACCQVEYLPSLNFYLGRDVTHCKSKEQLLSYLNYPKRVFLFLPLEDWQAVQPNVQVPHRELARHYDLYHHTDIVVITNR